MPEATIVAILSLVGTCVGSIAGIIASNKLTDFRLRKLEDKVDKHNHLVERRLIGQWSAQRRYWLAYCPF